MYIKIYNNSHSSCQYSLVVLIIITFLCNISPVFSQSYRQHNFGVHEGLSIDLTKDINCDSHGVIWIATDNGLAQYDGLKFKLYLEGLPTPYIKSFLKLASGQLIAITDMGLVDINSNLDSAYFKIRIKGKTTRSDSTVWYPKMAIEDRKGEIWIAENTRVLRSYEGGLKEYNFSPENTSFNYLRGFSIVEDIDESIYLFSFPGNLFYYDKVKDSFSEIKLPFQIKQINSFVSIDRKHFFVGTAQGLYYLSLKENNSVDELFLVGSSTADISSLLKIDQNNFLAGTWSNGLYRIKIDGKTITEEVFENSDTKKINNIFSQNGKDYWVSADNGITLLKPTFFNRLFPKIIDGYIQDIYCSDSDAIYTSDGSGISRISYDLKKYEILNIFPPNQYYVLQVKENKKGVWVADSRGRITLYRKDGREVSFKFPLSDLPIKHLIIDKDENIWACQDNTHAILRIDKNEKTTFFSTGNDFITSITVIRESRTGEIYCAGGNVVYKYEKDFNRFVKLTELPKDPKSSIEININDIAIAEGDSVFIGSTKGLFSFADGKQTKISLDRYSEFEVRAVCVDKYNMKWIGTGAGIIRYDFSSLALFDESDGLPARTISYRSITIDKKGRLFVGTARGLFVKSGEIEIQKSPTPFVVSIYSRNHKPAKSLTNEYIFLKGSGIQLTYMVIAYPGKEVTYQYRVLETDSAWSSYSNTNSAFLSQLPVGSYTVYVRAKLHGNHEWSEPLVIKIFIEPHWYESWLFYFSLVAIVILFVWLYIRYYNKKLITEKNYLEQIVAQRTLEISSKNEELNNQKAEIEYKNRDLELLLTELQEINATKDKFFSIISHDLKSPFTSLLGFTDMLYTDYDDFNDEERRDFIGKINQSAAITYKLIENLLEWSRSQRGKLNLEPENLSVAQLFMESVYITKDAADEKGIKLHNNYFGDIYAFADKATISTVLRNLLSNSVKFTPKNGEISLQVRIVDDMVEFQISDNGIGLSDEKKERLFKVDKAFTTLGTNSEKGTGLGLILCKEFIEKNKGTIRAESVEGEGTSFYFTLPLGRMEDMI